MPDPFHRSRVMIEVVKRCVGSWVGVVNGDGTEVPHQGPESVGVLLGAPGNEFLINTIGTFCFDAKCVQPFTPDSMDCYTTDTFTDGAIDLLGRHEEENDELREENKQLTAETAALAYF